MAQKAVEVGYEIMNGKKPAEPMILMPAELITRDNVGHYKGWSAPTLSAGPAPPGPLEPSLRRPPPRWRRDLVFSANVQPKRQMADVDLRRRSADRLRADGDRHRSARRARPSRRRRAAPPPTSPWASPGSASPAPSWARSATTRSAISWPRRWPTPASTSARCASPPQPAPRWPSSPCAPTASASSCSTATPAPTCCSPRGGRHRGHRRGAGCCTSARSA